LNPANDPHFLNQLTFNEKKMVSVHELFRRGEISFLLHDGQKSISQKIEESDSKEFLVLCSRQFGKSFFSLIFTLTFLTKNPNTKAIIFSATNKQAMTIVNDNLNHILRLAPDGFLTRKKSDRQWLLKNGSELRIGSIEDADASRGVNAQLIILEEGAASCSSEQYNYALSSVIGPMLLRSQNGRLIHVTTPSKDLNHCLHTEILPRLEQRNAVARFTIHDNPQLSEQQIKDARDRCQTEEAWDREFLVKIVKSQSLTVIPEFNQDFHLLPDSYIQPEKAHWCLGLDLGGTVDRTAAVLGYFDFKTSQTIIVDELFLPINTSTTEIVTAVNLLLSKVPKGHESVVTADAPGQVRIDMSRLGLSTFLPRKAAGSFEAGINNLRFLFTKNQVLIHPRCQNLIKTLEYGQYNKTRTDFQRSEELGHLDALAALIYQVRHQRTDNPYPTTHNLHRDTHFYDLHDKQTSDLESMLLS